MPDTFDIDPQERRAWISVVAGELYPDYLDLARELYHPVFVRFRQLVAAADNSAGLLRSIAREPGSAMVQLCRVFRKYVSPDTSVEMLKRRTRVEQIIAEFGAQFRPIDEVQQAVTARPEDDEALAVLLYEYKDRGQKGYDLSSMFFDWFEAKFAERFRVRGPRGAGRDVMLNEVLHGYPHATPADFLISGLEGTPLVVGFIRYDGDRGGAQEDDRIGGYGEKVVQIADYAAASGLSIRVLFVNDGPGLLLGSMWRDYARIDSDYPNVKVCTLKMLSDRVTADWIAGQP